MAARGAAHRQPSARQLLQPLALRLGNAQNIQGIAQPGAGSVRAEKCHGIEQRQGDGPPADRHEQGEQKVAEFEFHALGAASAGLMQGIPIPGIQALAIPADAEQDFRHPIRGQPPMLEILRLEGSTVA